MKLSLRPVSPWRFNELLAHLMVVLLRLRQQRIGVEGVQLLKIGQAVVVAVLVVVGIKVWPACRSG